MNAERGKRCVCVCVEKRDREKERERERARERFVVGVSAGERDVARMSLDVVGVTAE